MDQTICHFNVPLNGANNVKGQSSIHITNRGCKKDFTVTLCDHALGHKMPAYCIRKEPSRSTPSEFYQSLLYLKIPATENSWIHRSLKEWIRKIWGTDEDDGKHLLILDCALMAAS